MSKRKRKKTKKKRKVRKAKGASSKRPAPETPPKPNVRPEELAGFTAALQNALPRGMGIEDVARAIAEGPELLTTEAVEALGTDEIIKQLADFGVPFNPDEFGRDLQETGSAEKVSERWCERYEVTDEATDNGFLWMAATVLAKRLSPEQVTNEKINDLMQEGYEYFEMESQTCCDIWLEVWELVKKLIPEGVTSVSDADKTFVGLQCLFNWCQDLESELGNAAIDFEHSAGKTDYRLERLRYCQELIERFPETGEDIMVNFLRAIAETYFAIGEPEKGERAFERMVRDYPKNVWSYVAWGDMYGGPFKMPGAPEKDIAKARRLYGEALRMSDRDDFDREVALERLKELDES